MLSYMILLQTTLSRPRETAYTAQAIRFKYRHCNSYLISKLSETIFMLLINLQAYSYFKTASVDGGPQLPSCAGK